MIRLSCLADIPYLLEIEKLSFLPCDRLTKTQFIYGIKKGSIIVTDAGDIPIGYIYIINKMRIYSLAVLPEWRNMKIARTLLRHAEDICFASKAKVILEVRKDNRAAQCFYGKNGYRYYGERQCYYKDGMDAILMKKDLSNAER